MPDVFVLLALLAAVGLIVLLVGISSGDRRRSGQQRDAPAPSQRRRAAYVPEDAVADEDFYGDEDEFAVFGDEDDE